MTTPRPALAEYLDLQPHPEGGWFRRTWTAAAEFAPARAAASGIYFTLEPGQRSQWHTVDGDELWLWHRGAPLTLRLSAGTDAPSGPVTEVVLGPDLEHGQHPQLLVPAGAWQETVNPGPEETLVTCIVSPEFTFAGFRLLGPES